jgi:putative chitinase
MRITDLSESKSTKSEANYQNKPHAGQRCVNCTMWRDPNKCSAVAGNISPDGWCDWWAAGAYGKHGDSIEESEILDEGWRENLYKLVTIGALSLSTAAVITSKLQYDKWMAAHPQAVQSLAHPQSTTNKTTSAEPTGNAADTLSKIKPKPRPTDQEVDPLSKIRPHARPAQPEEKPLSQLRPPTRPNLDTLGPLSKTIHEKLIAAGITGNELVAFLAQSAHETRGFTSLTEAGSKEYFNQYDNSKKLGNNQTGDGYKYRGRGFLHLTGRYNYQDAQDALGYNLVNDPDLLTHPIIAADVAIWFWRDRVARHNPDYTNVREVTHHINSGYNGLPERRAAYKYISKLVKDFHIDTGEPVDENFKDGKHPGRKGLAKRSGVNTKASVTSLRNTAKHSTGEKQRMAHWLANMKSGRRKASESNDHLDEVTIDNKDGWGNVPYNQNVNYMGLRVQMTPRKFLELASELEVPRSVDSIEAHIRKGGSIGAPFLQVVIPPEWFDGDLSKPARIRGHEGRNRMIAVLKAEGNTPIETHLFFNGGVRNRDLTPEIIKRLNQDITSERETLNKGPWFALQENKRISESREQPRYTASEWAIISGGHALEEQKKDKLFSWMINIDKDI